MRPFWTSIGTLSRLADYDIVSSQLETNDR